MQWIEDVNSKSPSMVYIPHLSKLKAESFNMIKNTKIEKIEASDAGWLVIQPSKNKKVISLTLVFQE